MLPAPRARLPTFSVPVAVPTGEMIPPARPVTGVALPVAPVPVKVPVEVTSSPLAAVTDRFRLDGRLNAVSTVALLVPALIVTFGVLASPIGPLIETPPLAPVLVRVTGPACALPIGPLTVRTPVVVARATVGPAAV